MIVLPMTPAPTAGGAPASADGTDPALAEAFASMVTAMLNPQLAGFPITDPASQPAAVATDGVAISALAATPQTPTMAAFVPLATAQSTAGESSAIADALVPGTTPEVAAPVAAAATASAQLPAAGIDLTNVGDITVAQAETQALSLPTAGPALSAAAVIQARQPSTGKADLDVNGTAITETIAPTAPAAASTAGTVETVAVDEVEEIDGVEATTAQTAVDSLTHRSGGTTEVAATQKTTAAAAPAPVEPHQQIASIVAPLRRRGDGSYQLSLHLNPEHLGKVDLHVDLHDGTIDLHMRTQHEHARDLLVDNLDELKSELERAGLRAGSFDVGTSDQQRESQNGTRSSRPSFVTIADEPAEAAPIPVAAPTSSDSAIDVRA